VFRKSDTCLIDEDRELSAIVTATSGRPTCRAPAVAKMDSQPTEMTLPLACQLPIAFAPLNFDKGPLEPFSNGFEASLQGRRNLCLWKEPSRLVPMAVKPACNSRGEGALSGFKWICDIEASTPFQGAHSLANRQELVHELLVEDARVTVSSHASDGVGIGEGLALGPELVAAEDPVESVKDDGCVVRREADEDTSGRRWHGVEPWIGGVCIEAAERPMFAGRD
jgi:hypothetical protein